MLRRIRIYTNGLDKREKRTVIFAAEEIKKYLSQLTDDSIMLIDCYNDFTGVEKDFLSVGVGLSDEILPVEDKDINDSIFVDVEGKTGVITGVNSRSVLLAAYKYLKELGFKFVRPGKDGEYPPESLSNKRITVCEKASLNHRAVGLEGADFYENTVDYIDWLPKLGMNAFFIEFFIPMVFYKRWFEISPNPNTPKTHLEEDDVMGATRMFFDEMEKRGLLNHLIGHGWTARSFGVSANTWEPNDNDDVPEDVRQHLALLNGERKYHMNIPIATQCCYYNDETRKRFVDYVVSYCREQDYVEVLHIWLADATNNYCECEKCIDHTASDGYVKLLNDIDSEFTRLGMKTRIGAVVYDDTLWTPVAEKINNPSRFILTFGPISRSYSESYDARNKGVIKEYVRNNNKFPKKTADLMAHIVKWREETGCEVMLYDYHYQWDCYKAFGYYESAKRICEDIKELKNFDIHSFMSCQPCRSFFPTAFGQHIMAAALWDDSIDFEKTAASVLSDEFGKDWKKVADFLEELTQLMLPKVIRREEPVVGEENAVSFKKAYALADNFLKTNLSGDITYENEVIKTSWENLVPYCELIKLLMECYITLAEDNYKEETLKAIEEHVFEHEWNLRYVFDTYEFLKVVREFVDYSLTGIDRCLLP